MKLELPEEAFTGALGYGKSYQARTLLKMDDDTSVRIFPVEVQVDYLLNQISAEDLEHFVRPVCKDLNKRTHPTLDHQDPESPLST